MNKIFLIVVLLLAKVIAFAKRGIRLIERKNQIFMVTKRASRCGPGLDIKGLGVFTGIEDVLIGENVHIGEEVFMRGEGGVEIGDNTHISRRVTIYSINHEYEGKRLPYDDSVRKRKVFIGRNVWIGMNVTILPGAKILDGAIIGAGSVVAGTVDAKQIYGAPLSIPIGSRDENHYAELESIKAFGGVNGVEYKR